MRHGLAEAKKQKFILKDFDEIDTVYMKELRIFDLQLRSTILNNQGSQNSPFLYFF